eukprot:g6026.t1
MGFVVDANSELDVEVNSKPQSNWTGRQSTRKTQCTRSVTRRKRKPMTSSQSSFSRRCNSCGVTKTPQWREGPDGPRTLCNACGVRYSRERQDKSKLRKSKKPKSKTSTGFSSTKKRQRSSLSSSSSIVDPYHYDIALLFSSQKKKTPLSSPKAIRSRSSEEATFSGKEYAAALSLVSLAILGTGDHDDDDDVVVDGVKNVHNKLDGVLPAQLDPDEMEVDQFRTQGNSSLAPVACCRRSQRIMEANKSCTHYYGGFNIDEWVPNFVDLDEGSGCEGTTIGHSSHVEDGVAVGVPCVWAAMSSIKELCHHHHSMKKSTGRTTTNDQSFLLQNPCPSSASNSAKSDAYTQIKSNDHH